MRNGFQLQEGNDNNPRIDQQRLWFASNPSFLLNAGERGSLYMHYIVERLEERNMPQELALLPMIESAYNPMAYSRSDAVGLWQFIPSTGRYYNLRQTRTYDARRDIRASTQAALDYLSKLHDMFNGDWLLALAAYNAGEGTVSKAVERNQKLGLPTDYWNLPLPQETRDYVPKLLALSQVVMAPQAYGINLNPIANQPYFEVVEFNQRMDLSKVAAMAEVNQDELFLLNPAYTQGVTLDGTQNLLIPTGKSQRLAANLSNLKPGDLATWQNYQVRAGDTLHSLAKRNGSSVQGLKTLNNLDDITLHPGQQIRVPNTPGNLPAAESLDYAHNDAPKPVIGRKRTYTVKPGDNLTQIARINQVELKDLQHWNNLSGMNLRVGQTLVMQDTSAPKFVAKAVPWKKVDVTLAATTPPGNVRANINAPAAAAPQPGAKATQYKVQKGDSMDLVARRFNVEVQHLKRWNPRSAEALKPGQTLTVYQSR